ncbi:glycosyl-transferase for dystroglycan-domain-containing protein [Pilobolus umbonatus]|nr:glycosyl-transferase for dystroglycan-domain-containing protein [Pilobolus umbonatus]
MGPSDILPYFFKANSKLNKNDITISTIITSDRFPHLSRLATHYKGPISAAIHITDNESKEEIMSSLYDVFNTNPDMREYVDVHLIVDKYNRQFNMWRNVAKLYTRTSYLMMLDIDFYICTNFRDYILYNPILMDMLERGNTALVIPAFEYISQSDGDDYTRFPTNKDQLLQEVADGRLDMFHRDWQRGHGSTNYTKWYSADEVYKVDEYNYSYEPYVIFKKETSPWCDERFIGYGANKAACLYEIYVSGIEYYVVPDDFLIHQSHAYPEERRKKEREFNKKVYSHFREELCLRYIRQYMADGTWNTSIANNLKTECQKIPGLKAIVNNL